MAYQDSFAAPLAKKLVDKFRVTSLSYTRVSDPVYDPSTGVVTPGETTYPSAGAVYPSFVDQANGGPTNSIQIEVEICLADVGNIIPTTRDYITYEGRPWKVVEVKVNSGDVLYSATLTCKNN